jgi:hypothetical protein
MSSGEGPCLLCGRPSEKMMVHRERSSDPPLVFVRCERCGEYRIATEVAERWGIERRRNQDGKLNQADQDLLPYLRAHTRQASTVVTIGLDWRALATGHRRTPMSRKKRRFLELVQQRSSAPGDWVRLDPGMEPPRLDMRDSAEFLFVAAELKEHGHVRSRVRKPGLEEIGEGVGPATEIHEYQLTAAGWESLEPISGAGISGLCFVAMSFDASLNSAFDEGIRPAVENDCGLTTLRVDRDEHNDVITDRILAGIRSCQCVVADFTLQRQGVYFEAGFALGLGRTVIWTCREDDFPNVHFDTRQYNHVVWTTPPDLRRRLADRIKATVSLPVGLS